MYVHNNMKFEFSELVNKLPFKYDLDRIINDTVSFLFLFKTFYKFIIYHHFCRSSWVSRSVTTSSQNCLTLRTKKAYSWSCIKFTKKFCPNSMDIWLKTDKLFFADFKSSSLLCAHWNFFFLKGKLHNSPSLWFEKNPFHRIEHLKWLNGMWPVDQLVCFLPLLSTTM